MTSAYTKIAIPPESIAPQPPARPIASGYPRVMQQSGIASGYMAPRPSTALGTGSPAPYSGMETAGGYASSPPRDNERPPQAAAPSRVPVVSGPDSWRQVIPGEVAARYGNGGGSGLDSQASGITGQGRGSIPSGMPAYGGSPPAQAGAVGAVDPMRPQPGYSDQHAHGMPETVTNYQPGMTASQEQHGSQVRDRVRAVAARAGGKPADNG
jgi:hypothetical protein